MKNKNLKNIIMILLFFIGILILLYPKMSEIYNKKIQTTAIADYQEILEKYEEKDYSKYFDEAKKYNNKLNKLSEPYIMYEELTNYNDVLNTDSNGMIGYIIIDKINIKLPIYHGTSEEVLNIGVGHLEGSSFPIGGENTHSVLSAHRGLPSSKLFTNLDKLQKGDKFVIKVLNETLTYQVDKISIVKPKEIDKLKIENNKDYVTLMTCTPYGINSHRLLVRGTRVENEKEIIITKDAYKIDNNKVMLSISIPIIIIGLLITILKPIDNKKDLIESYIYPSKKKEDKGGIGYENKIK